MSKTTTILWPWLHSKEPDEREEAGMFQMKQVGARIAALRREHDMTQMALADRMGVSHQAVSKWERGESMPDISALPQLSQAFGTTVDYLLGGDAAQPTGEGRILSELAAHGNLEHLKDTVQLEDLADVAPLLKPSQIRQAAEQVRAAADKAQKIDLKAISTLAPFLDSDLLDALARKVAGSCGLRDIGAIAPFVSSAVIDELALKAVGEGNLSDITGLAPFISTATLDALARKVAGSCGLRDIGAIAPFVSSAVIDELALKAVGEGSLSDIAGLAPFISTATLDALALKATAENGLSSISALAPFLSKATLRELALGALSKGGDLGDLADLAPFMKD